MNYRCASNNQRIWGRQYQYDQLGNISAILDSERTNQNVPYKTYLTYTYDKQNQLESVTYGEEDNATTYTYKYDTAGNIRSINDGADDPIHEWEYNNPQWADLLTSFDHHAILYEGQSDIDDNVISGNPIQYYNGTSWRFSWAKDRQLISATDEDNSININYAYDIDGIRNSKTVGNVTYNYNTLNGLVIRQEWGNESLDFIYDENGQPFAMIHTAPNENTETETETETGTGSNVKSIFYYILNCEGDVVGLMDQIGNMIAEYEYDPWGKLLDITPWGSLPGENEWYLSVAEMNPLRYRGYYYDTETGFYYLQTRYYDPAICRFINADSIAVTDSTDLLGSNMFAYCENNPIGSIDPDGLTTKVLSVDTSCDHVDPFGTAYYSTSISYSTSLECKNLDCVRPTVTIYGTLNFKYSVGADGKIKYYNKQNDSCSLRNWSISEALAKEMYDVSKKQVDGALCGRTIPGLARELYYHKLASTIFYSSKALRITDIGSLEIDSIGYDYNAKLFENGEFINTIIEAIK